MIRVLHKVWYVFLKKSGIWYTYLFQLKGHKILSLQYIIPPLVLGMMHKIFRVRVLLANHLDNIQSLLIQTTMGLQNRRCPY